MTAGLRRAVPALGALMAVLCIVGDASAQTYPSRPSNLGTAEVGKADPDGYTLIFAAPGPFVINKTLETLPYNPETDFELISLVGMLANVLVVNPKKIPASTVAEFIAY